MCNTEGSKPRRLPRNLKPVRAVGDPPGEHTDGDGGADGPPDWEGEVGDEAEGGEGHPEDFLLHKGIVAESLAGQRLGELAISREAMRVGARKTPRRLGSSRSQGRKKCCHR